MSTSTATTIILCFALALCASDANAARRAIRVDGFGDTWTTFDGKNGDPPGIGSANCPGTAAGASSGNTLIQLIGAVFSGRQNTAYLVDDYCQVAKSGTLTSQNYFYADEPGLARLFADNPGDQITAIRYEMFDQDRFNFTTPPTGFQWGFYSFPSGTTIVGLYGLQSVTLTINTYIIIGATNIFDGANGYNGEYFCFDGTTYIGTWDGDASDYTSVCTKAALGRIFGAGFES